jgi:hypothetical protein
VQNPALRFKPQPKQLLIAANEELIAANQELVAANEELIVDPESPIAATEEPSVASEEHNRPVEKQTRPAEALPTATDQSSRTGVIRSVTPATRPRGRVEPCTRRYGLASVGRPHSS